MRGFWDRVAGLYDLAELLNRRANLAMKRETALWVPPGSRVLDCAAGTGALSLAAARRAGYVLCTDLSPDMLARAKGKGAGGSHEHGVFPAGYLRPAAGGAL